MKKQLILICLVLLALAWQLLHIFLPALLPPIRTRVATFAELPHWQDGDLRTSLQVFKQSCKIFIHQKPEKMVGSAAIKIHAYDWQPVCAAAQQLQQPTTKDAREFFQTWLQPVEFVQRSALSGKFTGYYLPLLEGRTHASQQFPTPLYSIPSDLVTADLQDFSKNLPHKRITGHLVANKLQPYPSRTAINHGALKNKAYVVAWVRSQMDRLILEIEGSGVVQLPNRQLIVGYAGENGAPYTSIPSLVIKAGIMQPDEASMHKIKQYFTQHPQIAEKIINQNQSFVFFRDLQNNQVVGAEGVPLTPKYSLAVDKRFVPMGTPLWLISTNPKSHQNWHRLMVAQDTGGAIKGAVRGDIFFGAGEAATIAANSTQETGKYWLLLPKTVKLS